MPVTFHFCCSQAALALGVFAACLLGPGNSAAAQGNPKFAPALLAPVPVATVYRDPHGVAHIEANGEVVAWYALGYEHARDGLLYLQMSSKRVRGEATKYLSAGSGIARLQQNLLTDMLVQIMGTYPTNLGTAQLRGLFAPSDPSIPGNFYDNCVAFAAGVNAYRERVRTASNPSSDEFELQQWLQAPSVNPTGNGVGDFRWVYQDAVHALDFAWYGRWLNAWLCTNAAIFKNARINASGASYGFTDGAAEAEPELLEFPSTVTEMERLESFKELFAGLPGMGSNGFCWSKDYCQETNGSSVVNYSGLMASPHGPKFAGTYGQPSDFMTRFLLSGGQDWYAHIKVTLPGATSPVLDAYGAATPGMAAFFIAHNQDVAWGGSLGAPNWSDAFVLRLDEQQSGPQAGEPTANLSYYSYYTNGMVPLSAPPQTQCAIKRHDGGPDTLIPYWRAGRFGVVFPDLGETVEWYKGNSTQPPALPVIYGEEATTSPWEWRVKPGELRMRFWNEPDAASPPINRDPMVVAMRVPMDPEVGGESFHWMYPKSSWEMSHADSVQDIHQLLNAQAASYFVNFCCVDRAGDVLATHLGAIPKRGDYSLPGGGVLFARGIHSFPDLWTVYSGRAGPVPARRLQDEIFDWRFSGGAIEYLDLSSNGGSRAYKAKLDYSPSLGTPAPQFPAWVESGAGPTWAVQNGRFAVMNNSHPWHASLKTGKVVDNGSGAFNYLDAIHNDMLQAVLDAGTAYQTIVFIDEATDRNQIVTDRLTQIAKTISPNSPAGALPRMTRNEAKAAVVDPTLYAADEYVGTPPALANLPPPIRVVKEIALNLGSGGTTQPSNGWPREEADAEAKFFHDLWDALHNSPYWISYRASGQPQALSLKQIWVDNAHQQAGSNTAARQTMWYDDPQQPHATLRWLDMPIGFALIDFEWDQSEIGASSRVSHVPGASGFSPGDAAEFQALVNWLETWGGSPSGPYVMAPDSSAAALYEMWRIGYSARGATHGRHWQALDDGSRAELWSAPWSTFATNAFAFGQVESARATTPAFAIEQRVYDALYWDSAHQYVRDGQHPLTEEHINHITRFLLGLGGFFLQLPRPLTNAQVGGAGPSTKMARYELLVDSNNNGLRDEMLASYRPTYPLTAGLARMTAARRLLDAGRFMGGLAAIQTQTYSTYFRARLCDHYGATRWPAAVFGSSADCWGGQLGEARWEPDPLATGSQASVNGRGFQRAFVRRGNTNTPLLTLFPDNGGPPQSYFWSFPGVRSMVPDDPSFAGSGSLMPNITGNQLAETYYSTYRPYYYATHSYR